MDFLGSLPRIREILQTDVEAAFNGDPAAASKEEIIVSYPFVEAISVQRLAHGLRAQWGKLVGGATTGSVVGCVCIGEAGTAAFALNTNHCT